MPATRPSCPTPPSSTWCTPSAALGTLLLTAWDEFDHHPIDPHGVIDTRQLDQLGNSNGNSENIRLVAPLIDVMAGGELLANIVSAGPSGPSYNAGSVTLDATGAANGSITIAGTVAGGLVTLKAGASITLAATALVDTRNFDPTGTFSLGSSANVTVTAPTINAMAGSQAMATAVNTNGTTYAAGSITFDATGSAAGTVTAAGTVSGGNVTLQAGSSIAIGAAAVLNTAHVVDSDQGTAYGTVLLAAPTVTVASGAQFFAQTAEYDINRSALIVGDPTLDTADAGNAGFISNATIASYVAALGGQGTFRLDANNSITIDAHGIIDTRTLDTSVVATGVSAGNSLGLTLAAPSITLAAGGQLLANVANANNLIYGPGDITLTALSANLPNGAPAATGILVKGTIKGGNVNLTTDLTPISVTSSGVIDTRQLDASGHTSGIPLDITLTGQSISVAGQLLADAVNANGTTYVSGNITLASQSVATPAGAVLHGAIVQVKTLDSDVVVGAAGDPNAGISGFLSNGTLASYVAASSGSATFELSATHSLTVDAGGAIDGGSSIGIELNAPTVTVAASSTVRGTNVSLTAGTVNIDVGGSTGAQLVAGTALQLNAPQVNLVGGASAMIVGNSSQDTADAGAAGFVTSAVVAGYAQAMGGKGTLQLQATASITVDPHGIVDGRQLAANVSTGNSVNIALSAPTIDIASGGQVRAEAVNANATAYTPGNVTLTALGAGSGITVYGTITGGNIALTTDQQPIAIASTGLIDARQLDNNSAPTGPALTIALSGPSVTVAAGAQLRAGTVDFGITHGAVIIGDPTADSADAGNSGFISNATVASYIAAMGGSGIFELSAATSITLDAHAAITAGSAMAVWLQAPSLAHSAGAKVTAGIAHFAFDRDDVIVGTSADTADAGKAGFVTNGEIANLLQIAAGSGTFAISADDTITIDADGVIDGRNPGGSPIGISLGAKTITVAGTLEGGATALNAGNAITLAATGVIATNLLDGSGHSTGNAQSITLTAPSITLAAGSQVLANAVNTTGPSATTFTNGDVTLTATSSMNLPVGPASASTGITIAGTIKGGNIDTELSATAISSYTDSSVGFEALAAQTLLASLLGINGGYVGGTSSSTLDVSSGAIISGSGSVTLAAAGSERAEDPAFVVALTSPFAAAVVVGEISGSVTTQIDSGATITAGGALTVSARNTALVTLLAATITTQSTPFGLTVAYGGGNVTTAASIASGATISAGSLDVSAYNSNSFSVAATTNSFGGGKASFALALSDFTTAATATLGASVGTNASKVGNVTVQAASITAMNATSAASATGEGIITSLPAAGIIAVCGKIAQILGIRPVATGGDLAWPNSLASVSYAQSSQSAQAAIAASLAGAAAPVIISSGDVAVISTLLDRGVRSNAQQRGRRSQKTSSAGRSAGHARGLGGHRGRQVQPQFECLYRAQCAGVRGADRRGREHLAADSPPAGLTQVLASRGLLAYQRHIRRRQRYPDELRGRDLGGQGSFDRRRAQLFQRRKRYDRLGRQRHAAHDHGQHRRQLDDRLGWRHDQLGDRPHGDGHDQHAKHRYRRQSQPALDRQCGPGRRRGRGRRRRQRQLLCQQHHRRHRRRRRRQRAQRARGLGFGQRHHLCHCADLRIRCRHHHRRHHHDRGDRQHHARLDQQSGADRGSGGRHHGPAGHVDPLHRGCGGNRAECGRRPDACPVLHVFRYAGLCGRQQRGYQRQRQQRR